MRQTAKPPQRYILYCLKQITLIATKTSTKISGMPVCTKHCFNSSESSVSMHSLNVRIEDIIITVKKSLCRSKPKESRCQTIIPSFLCCVYNQTQTNSHYKTNSYRAFTYQDVFDENDYNDRDQNQWVNRQEQDRPNNCRHSDIVSAFIVLH